MNLQPGQGLGITPSKLMAFGLGSLMSALGRLYHPFRSSVIRRARMMF